MGIEWIDYIIRLRDGLVSLDEEYDVLKWSYNKSTGDITTKLVYQMLYEDISYYKQWWHSLWS